MRVITGTARGRRLIPPEGSQVRPTPDRVKEALYNIIQFEVEGRSFLDLFAGSGQIGIEALSRGAARAVFVDASKESAAVVQKNLQITGFGSRAQVYQTDALDFLRRYDGRFDLAFLDPPYHSGLLEAVLPALSQRMNRGGAILCEHPQDEELPQEAGGFRAVRSYRYGKILLTVFRHKEMTE